MPGTTIKPVPPAAEDVVAIVEGKVKYARSKLEGHDGRVREWNVNQGPIRRPAQHRARLVLLLERYERDLAWVKRAAEGA